MYKLITALKAFTLTLRVVGEGKLPLAQATWLMSIKVVVLRRKMMSS